MIQRCHNLGRKDYKNYGGRGISVCKKWRVSFDVFLKDVGRRPTKKHTLDRIDNSKNYYPRNVCWRTRKEQARNRRTNRMLSFKGKNLTITEWAELAAVSRETFHYRLERGWSMEQAVMTPLQKKT